MKKSFWEKITGLNSDDLNQGEFALINETIKEKELFFNELEKESNAAKTDKKKNDLAETAWLENEGELRVDVYQTSEEVIVQSTIAGAKKKDLNISVEEDIITIKGKREKTVAENAEYLHQECFWGKFSRSILLPQTIEPAGVKATLKSGVLTVVLPKTKNQNEKKSIKINSSK